MRAHLTIVLLAASLAATPTQAQTLNVRPVRFADPRPGTQAQHGEVVLGQTTLKAALRMFAEVLNADSVVVPRGHPGNPSAVPSGTAWEAGAREVHPRHRLDLGLEQYSLWFDENERLVAAVTSQGLDGLTRAVLMEHYPSVRAGRRWYSGDESKVDDWAVALDRCVTLVAQVSLATEQVEQLSYLYTCATKPLGGGTAVRR